VITLWIVSLTTGVGLRPQQSTMNAIDDCSKNIGEFREKWIQRSAPEDLGNSLDKLRHTRSVC